MLLFILAQLLSWGGGLGLVAGIPALLMFGIHRATRSIPHFDQNGELISDHGRSDTRPADLTTSLDATIRFAAWSICALVLSFVAFLGFFAWSQSRAHHPPEAVEAIVESEANPASEQVDDGLGPVDAEAEFAE